MSNLNDKPDLDLISGFKKAENTEQDNISAQNKTNVFVGKLLCGHLENSIQFTQSIVTSSVPMSEEEKSLRKLLCGDKNQFAHKFIASNDDTNIFHPSEPEEPEPINQEKIKQENGMSHGGLGFDPALPPHNNNSGAVNMMVNNTSAFSNVPQAAGRTPRLEAVALGYEALMAENIPIAINILPWMKYGCFSMVAAPRGLGKSLFALFLAVCIATGRDFMRWAIERPCGVLYVDGEMALSDFRKRLKGFLPSKPPHPLEIINHKNFYETFKKDLRIDSPNVQKYILEYLDDRPEIKFVIFDNLSCLLSINENSSDEWREKMLPFIQKCQRRDIAVLLVHHLNKSKKQRGTGAREDQLDISIQLNEVNDDPNDGAFFEVEFKKNRAVFGDIVKPFRAKLKTNEQGLFEWDIDDGKPPVKVRLHDYLKKCYPQVPTGGEAVEAIDATKGAISKAKDKLVEDGVLMPGTKLVLVNPPDAPQEELPVTSEMTQTEEVLETI